MTNVVATVGMTFNPLTAPKILIKCIGHQVYQSDHARAAACVQFPGALKQVSQADNMLWV